jgi:hypothetical protein
MRLPTKSFSLGQSARSDDIIVSHKPRAALVLAIEVLTEDLLRCTRKVNGLDTTDLLLSSTGHSRTSLDGGGSDEVGGSDKRASLNGGRGQLTSQGATKSLGKSSGSHGDNK